MVPNAAEKIKKTVQLDASTVEIEERGVKLRLTVVDTPGFGDAINNNDSFGQIIRYIDEQFERYLTDESGLNRKNIVDNRVHCCFYFISPYGHGLKPLDIEVKRFIQSTLLESIFLCLNLALFLKSELFRVKRGEKQKVPVDFYFSVNGLSYKY